jgi:hypothetical protein
MGGGGNVTINRVEGRRERRRHNNYFEPQASEGDSDVTGVRLFTITAMIIRMPRKLWIDECFVELRSIE